MENLGFLSKDEVLDKEGQIAEVSCHDLQICRFKAP